MEGFKYRWRQIVAAQDSAKRTRVVCGLSF